MAKYKSMSYGQMAKIIKDISVEVKRRNPLWVNIYAPIINQSADALLDLQDMKDDNQTMDDD